MLSEEQLREIEERMNKATPAPWILGHADTQSLSAAIDWMTKIILHSSNPDLWCTGVYETDDPDAEFLFTAVTGNGPTSCANADFIANARQDNLALLATIRELQARLDDSEHGFKLALGDSGEYRRQVEELQARVAELEPDAKLGRMVREMPVEQRLIHTVYGDWWYGRNVRGEFGATGASPEAVLEAARKEQP